MPHSPNFRPLIVLLASTLFILFFVAAFFIYWPDSADVQPGKITNAPPTSDWYGLYFSAPHAPSARFYQDGPDRALAAAINGAYLSVDMAAYDLDLVSLRSALIKAHRRGVTVRLVVESDNLEQPEFQALKTAGIPVIDDRRPGLMHDKFVVIDRLEVWTGSMNYTSNGSYRNDNNLLRIRSASLAEAFTAEFVEMFVDRHFGELSPPSELVPTISVEGRLLEVYFAPEDDFAARLVELIEAAHQNVYFLAYAFTADDIATAMLESVSNGVTVSGVFEATQINPETGSEYERLRRAGLDVRRDSNSGNMHHKVIIVDGQIVVTGSYNFSASAQDRNDENALVIHDPQIAAQYLTEFERIYQQAKP
jgi:phosphatidylserine/phosphatidylglycerophosphate/cardiolipin synthase-like enzyme